LSEAPIDPQLTTTYYVYVLVFFAVLAAVSLVKLLVGKGRGRRAIR